MVSFHVCWCHRLSMGWIETCNGAKIDGKERLSLPEAEIIDPDIVEKCKRVSFISRIELKSEIYDNPLFYVEADAPCSSDKIFWQFERFMRSDSSSTSLFEDEIFSVAIKMDILARLQDCADTWSQINASFLHLNTIRGGYYNISNFH